MCRRFDN